MRTWRHETSDEVPPPALVAAWLALNCLATERVPFWAAHWLADGQDGPALRELAGLSGRDPHEVRDLLPAALQEAGADVAARDDFEAVRLARQRASVRLVYRHVAALYLNGLASPRWVIEKVVEIGAGNNHEEAVYDEPLGGLFVIDDEWGADWGRSDDALNEAVRMACRQQLAVPE